MQILAEYVNTLEEATSAANEMQHAKQVVLWYLVSVLMAIMLFLSQREFFGIVPLSIFIAACIAFPFLDKIDARNKLRKLPDLDETFHIKITDSEFTVSSKSSDLRLSWTMIRKFHEGKKGFLLFYHPGVAEWFPKRAFRSEEDMELFIELARKRVSDFYGS
jgi:hypothetical protein